MVIDKMNNTGNLLIIDDEPGLRSTLSRILQTAGCRATGASGGLEALRLISTDLYDLVILDLHLPDMDGIKVLQEIRKIQPRIPVILLTAYGTLDSAVQAVHLGAVDYLLKPIKPDEFLDRVRKILRDQQVEKRRKEIQAEISSLQYQLSLLDKQTISNAEPAWEPEKPEKRYIHRGLLSLDLEARKASFGDTILNLPPTTFDYLIVLARHSPEVVTYQTLVNESQGYTSSIIEARELSKWHVHKIRQELEHDPANPRCLLNIRGKGYRLLLS